MFLKWGKLIIIRHYHTVQSKRYLRKFVKLAAKKEREISLISRIISKLRKKTAIHEKNRDRDSQKIREIDCTKKKGKKVITEGL